MKRVYVYREDCLHFKVRFLVWQRGIWCVVAAFAYVVISLCV
ncbi:hypothetical protein GCWU000325_01101 [Alloprevotella tannerae ATCC 51259]|uniref:Uncharacterized protein n=1 Tax=Alloprevotella tannerae ATCC 51259 TaxID=626522 RepID=C9LFW3_9BACT|nr:hypothetical protein GCWU000325_01101 [Alloprevotella tannerae ATCC 51259]